MALHQLHNSKKTPFCCTISSGNGGEVVFMASFQNPLQIFQDLKTIVVFFHDWQTDYQFAKIPDAVASLNYLVTIPKKYILIYVKIALLKTLMYFKW